jgi:hypothetical protein
MATQLQNGKQQFLDSNGDPLVGGKVYHYIPSTSTLKDTWQDQAQTILNTNPIILDSNGQAVIWGDGAYRQLLTDAADVVIWDQEVIDSVGAVESGFSLSNSQIPAGEIGIDKLEDLNADVVLGRLSTAGAATQLPVGDAVGEFVRWDNTRTLEFDAASAAGPSVTFEGDIDTGFYSFNDGTVGLSSNGAATFRGNIHFGRGDWTDAGDNGNGVGDYDMVRMSSVNTFQQAATNETNVFSRRGSDGSVMAFRREDVDVGSISVTGVATAYNTSSDYRLKENISPIADVVNNLMDLKPCEFDWVGRGERSMGFIAHELQEILPNAVTGEKDGEEMQAADYSKVVPLLTAALQEALIKINKLEDRVNKLESR